MRNNLNFKSFKPDNFVDGSAKMLGDLIQDSLKRSGKVNVALSGGSSPLPIYSKLSTLNLDWKNIHFFMVDERCVSIEDPNSNYGNIHKSLLCKVASKSFSMVIKGWSFKECSVQYEKTIKKHVVSHNNIPQFDLIVLGMGYDGHTASLFPETSALLADNLVALNEVPKLSTYRITMTYKLISNSRKVVLLINDQKKKDVLMGACQNTLPISRLIPSIDLILNTTKS